MKKQFIFSLLLFFIYSLLTIGLFYQRLPVLSTHYAMPDVDTDGGLWYQWYVHTIKERGFVYDITPFAGFPYGYDIALSPAENLVYSTQIFILRHLSGFSWDNLILITNISSLITYPLSALFAYFLCYYITKNKTASFIGGLIFGFSFYHVFMGRGQMSINHIEFIPLFFLAFIYYLNKKNTFALLLTGLMLGILFKTDAYYAFFSMLFTPLLFLFYRYKKVSLFSFVREGAILYTVLLVLCILLNFNFVLGNLYLFDTETRVLTGRNSVARNELTTILYFFFPFSFNLLHSFFAPLGRLIYGLPIFLSFLGLFFLKERRVFLAIFSCLILSLILSMYIPSLYWVDLLYFKFFSMFRGVGRLILISNLFIGILVAMTFAYLLANYKRIHKYSLLITIIFTFLFLLGAISTDDTWRRQTNFSAIAKVYSSLRDDPESKVLAVYPNTLNFNNVGFPQPYQLVGQIIHEKYFANGADFRITTAPEYQGKIKDISYPETVDVLRESGVDTILIYNNLLPGARKINQQLQQDKRVIVKGRFTSEKDKGYSSANDKARDISIYKIKDVQPFEHIHFFIKETNQKIPFEKISAEEYKLTIPASEKESTLIFTYPYSNKWGLFSDRPQSILNYFSYVNSKEVSKNTVHNDYQNSWKLSANVDDTTYRVFFKPVGVKRIGDVISFVTFVGSGILLIVLLKKSRYNSKI